MSLQAEPNSINGIDKVDDVVCHNGTQIPFSTLIVDDEIDTLILIQQQLQHYGLHTCCFTKPSIALEHYKTSSNTHRLIISDLQMPKFNGFEFVRKVKEIDSNAKVFIMTCFETDDLELSLLSFNPSLSGTSSTKLIIDEFIQKPFSIDKLIRLIKKHMSDGTKDINMCQDNMENNDQRKHLEYLLTNSKKW
jgi:DNA-binding NtrC family response regulator